MVEVGAEVGAEVGEVEGEVEGEGGGRLGEWGESRVRVWVKVKDRVGRFLRCKRRLRVRVRIYRLLGLGWVWESGIFSGAPRATRLFRACSR